jgi:hypothetical protein
MTTMTARYRGICACCTGPIRKGQAIVYDRDRRSAFCSPACAESDVVVTRFASGATTFRNRRGRCEDAPCCGCCE